MSIIENDLYTIQSMQHIFISFGLSYNKSIANTIQLVQYVTQTFRSPKSFDALNNEPDNFLFRFAFQLRRACNNHYYSFFPTALQQRLLNAPIIFTKL